MMLTGSALLLAAAPAAAEVREFDVAPFTSIASESAPEVLVRVGPAFSVTADGDPQALAALDITVEDDKLIIRSRPDAGRRGRLGRAVVQVTAPALSRAIVEGSGDMQIDRIVGGDFKGSTHGSGNLLIGFLQTGATALSSHGSGNVTAAGTADSLRLFASGSGNVVAGGVAARTATVRTTGSGNVTATAREDAELVASGSGNAVVTGTSTCRVRGTGSGSVRCG